MNSSISNSDLFRFLKGVLLHGSVALFLLLLYLAFAAGETSDPFQYKLSARNPSSMVCGMSRANNGIVPSVLSSCSEAEGPWLNFAFAGSVSRYGKTYSNAVLRRIASGPGVVVLEVSPTGFSGKELAEGDQTILSRMRGFGPIHRLEYLLLNYKNPKAVFLLRSVLGLSRLHRDGYYEHRLRFSPPSLKANTLHAHTERMAKVTLDEGRFESFRSLAVGLKEMGKTVVVVRLPMDREFADLENSAYPQFDQRMQSICSQLHMPYDDFSTETDVYETLEGNHLAPAGAARFSAAYAERLCVRLSEESGRN